MPGPIWLQDLNTKNSRPTEKRPSFATQRIRVIKIIRTGAGVGQRQPVLRKNVFFLQTKKALGDIFWSVESLNGSIVHLLPLTDPIFTCVDPDPYSGSTKLLYTVHGTN